jgi:hypothetical protein
MPTNPPPKPTDTDQAIALLIKAKADIANGHILPAKHYIDVAIDLLKVSNWDAVEAELVRMGVGHDPVC